MTCLFDLPASLGLAQRARRSGHSTLEVTVGTQHPEGNWLMIDDRVLSSATVADTRSLRRRGLLGQRDCDGALVLPGTGSVHTMGMSMPIDVLFCDRSGDVVAMYTLPPWRITRPRWRISMAVETAAGEFERWGIAIGDRITLA